MAKDRFKTRHDNPWVAWIASGVLLVLVVGLVGAHKLLPRRSPADDAQTADAVRNMDEAETEADARREEKRSAAASP